MNNLVIVKGKVKAVNVGDRKFVFTDGSCEMPIEYASQLPTTNYEYTLPNAEKAEAPEKGQPTKSVNGKKASNTGKKKANK